MIPDLDTNAEYEALLEFLYVCPVGIAQLDGNGAVEMMNSEGARILMQVAARPDVTNWFDALGPAGAELRALAQGMTADRGTVCEAHRVSFEVPRRATPLSLSFTLVKLSPSRTMAVIADESVSVEQTRVARQAEQRVTAVFEGIRDYAIFALDREGRVETWNKSAERVFGYAGSTDRLKQVLRGAIDGGSAEDEGWWARKATTRFWGSSVVSVIEEADGGRSGYIVVTRDLTKKKREADDLRDAATKDFLTGLLNRRGFEESAREELARWQRGRDPLAVLMIDVDHFKKVNDTYGHATGDDVLRALARSVQGQVRELDLVARLGGEELAVVLPSTDVVGARAAAERIRQAIEGLRVPAADGAMIRFSKRTERSTRPSAGAATVP